MYIPPQPKPADEIVGGCIAIWRNVWKNTDKIINDVEKTVETNVDIEWIKAKTFAETSNSDNADVAHRNNSLLPLKQNASKNETLRSVSNNYFDLIASCAEWYRNHFDIEEIIYINEDFNFLKYQTGEEYHAHYDGGTWTKRVFSPILYLNEDYEGGEIEFVNQNIKIKPEAGTFLIFPANYAYRHIAHPVKTGTKYAIVTWLHDAN